MARGAGKDRGVKQRVKTARGRKASSTRWLQRQLNDPYVAKAKAAGYRSRAAFKLAELDDRFGLLTRGQQVLDLGAAPGGWTQVAAERTGGEPPVVAVDIADMEPLAGAALLTCDMTDPDSTAAIRAALGGPADLVLSDMSPATTGHTSTDHIRIIGLVEAAYDLACALLAPGGSFAAKVFRGGTERELLEGVKQRFAHVRHAKPAASRKGSPEIYLIATGFRGKSES